MEAKILIESDRVQIVLQPENELERALMKGLGEKRTHKATVRDHPGFYRTQGGYTGEGRNDSIAVIIDNED